MKIQDILNYIVRQAEKIAATSVLALKSHVYDIRGKVSVVNFPKSQTVKGSVIVANQKNVEEELKKTRKSVDTLISQVKSIVIPQAFKVTNLDEIPKPEKIEIPTEITVTNQVKSVEVSNLSDAVDAIGEVKRSIDKLKLDPKINVATPEVKVPAPQVTVKAPDVKITNEGVKKKEIELMLRTMMERLFGKDASDYISVRLTDGEKFYQALDRMISASSSSSSFQLANGNKARALVDGDGHSQVDVLSMPEINVGGNLIDDDYDYVGVTYPDTSTEVYTFKTGGASGTTVATVTVAYSDAVTKEIITSVTKV